MIRATLLLYIAVLFLPIDLLGQDVMVEKDPVPRFNLMFGYSPETPLAPYTDTASFFSFDPHTNTSSGGVGSLDVKVSNSYSQTREYLDIGLSAYYSSGLTDVAASFAYHSSKSREDRMTLLRFSGQLIKPTLRWFVG